MNGRMHGGDGLAYTVVAASLVTLGVIGRSAILNWVMGPAFVVLGVTLVSSALGRRAARR